MTVDNPRQLFEGAVNAVLKGTEMGEGTVPVYDSASVFINQLTATTPMLYDQLVKAVEGLQSDGVLLLELNVDFPSRTTLKEQVKDYVRKLLVQECLKALQTLVLPDRR